MKRVVDSALSHRLLLACRRRVVAWGLMLVCLTAMLPGGNAAAFADTAATAAKLPGRPMISLDQVSAALASARFPIENATIQLLVKMTAANPGPKLEIGSVEPWGERRARIRIACADHAECLPFYVSAEWATAAEAQTALGGVKQPGPLLRSTAPMRVAEPRKTGSPVSASAAAAARPLTGVASLVPVRGEAADSSSDRELIVVRAGTHATLLMDGDRLHIKVPVVCLESGAAGRTIRVSALDHKQTYHAEVVDATLLKASL